MNASKVSTDDTEQIPMCLKIRGLPGIWISIKRMRNSSAPSLWLIHVTHSSSSSNLLLRFNVGRLRDFHNLFWDTRMVAQVSNLNLGSLKIRYFARQRVAVSLIPQRRLFFSSGMKTENNFIAQTTALTTTTSSPWKYLLVLLLSFTAFSNVLLPLCVFAAVWTSKIWWCAWVQSTHHPKPQPSSALSALEKLKLLARASKTSRWVEGFFLRER